MPFSMTTGKPLHNSRRCHLYVLRDPHLPLRLRLRSAPVSVVRPVLPGGPRHQLLRGLRHRRHHLPEGTESGCLMLNDSLMSSYRCRLRLSSRKKERGGCTLFGTYLVGCYACMYLHIVDQFERALLTAVDIA